jgi:hypothetical protein
VRSIKRFSITTIQMAMRESGGLAMQGRAGRNIVMKIAALVLDMAAVLPGGQDEEGHW